MKSIQLALLLFVSFFKTVSQASQVDSVVIRHCRDNTVSHSLSVDSFDVNGLLMNSTVYSDDSLHIPWSQSSLTYSPSYRLLHKVYSNYLVSSWVTSRDEAWQYDIHDSLTSYTNLHYYSGIPSLGNRDLFSFDSLGRQIEYIHQVYDDSLSAFINDTRTLFSYDTTNNIKIEIHQNYNDSLSIWVNHSRNTIYTDVSGKIFSVTSESWISPGVFTLVSTHSYYYLPNDSLEHISITYNILGDSTVTQYAYDSTEYLVSVSMGEWSFGVMALMNDSTNYYYGGNHNQIAVSHYSRDPFSLTLCDSSTNAFDISNRLINYYHSAYGFCGVGGQSGWYVYSPAGFIDSLNSCEWSMGILMCSTCSIEYISLTSDVNTINTENNFHLFPNPVNDEITIAFRVLLRPVIVTFTDNLGRLIKEISVRDKMTRLSVSDLPAGIYFVSIEGYSYKPIRIVKF